VSAFFFNEKLHQSRQKALGIPRLFAFKKSFLKDNKGYNKNY
jgi:hypothetical protein